MSNLKMATIYIILFLQTQIPKMRNYFLSVYKFMHLCIENYRMYDLLV